MIKSTFIWLILLTLASCSLYQKPAPESGVSKHLAAQRAKAISDLKYHLAIDVPDYKDEPIEGEASIRFELNKQQTIYLDFKAKDDQLHQLIINNDTINNPQIINEHIKLDKKSLYKGSNNIKVHFTAGDGALNRNNDYFYTLFVPDRARTAIPCFDQPDIKGRFSVAMDLPENWTGVANGQQTIKQIKDGRIQLVFAPSRPISTYLWAFTAGKYQYTSVLWKKKNIGLFHMVDDTAKFNRNINEVFRQTVASLDWLEDFTEFDYPFATYNLIAIPSFQFGGMEHPGATYYRSEKLFLDENPTRNEELSRANLIAHETAHMWFGDLVTMPWFNEVWLKEVFANFIADKITEPWFPEMNHKLRFMLAHFPAAYAVDRTEGANPIGQKLKNLKNAGTLYGSIIYHKSPIVMKHLENIAGEEHLKKGIQEYIARHAYGNASWNDLISCVDKYTETDLKVWSNAWVFEPGRPVIYFEPSRQGDNTWKLMQTAENPQLSKKGTFWPQEINTVQNDTLHYQYQMFDAEMRIEEKPELNNTLFLADEKGYGLVRMTEPQIKYWLEHTVLLKDELLRGRMVINLHENFLDGSIHPDTYIKYLLHLISKEENPLLVNQLCRQLQTCYWNFLPVKERSSWSKIAELSLWDFMQKSSIPANKKTLFRSWSNICLSDTAIMYMGHLLNRTKTLEGISLGEQDRMSLLAQVCIKNHPEALQLQELVMQQLNSRHNKEKLAFIRPSLSSNAADRDAFFLSLAKPENRQKEAWVQNALANLHHPLRTNLSVHYLRSTIELLEEIQTTGDIFFPIGWLGNSFGSHSSEEAYTIANNFLQNHPNYPEHLELKILQNIDMTKRASRTRKKYYN